MKYLVVIDMQPQWFLRDNSLIYKTAAYVNTWSKKYKTILVEYGRNSPTHSIIKNCAKNSTTIYKHDCDGSIELDLYFASQYSHRNYRKDVDLYICGCYTGQCVADTTYSLQSMGYNPKLIFELCQQFQETDKYIKNTSQYYNPSRPRQYEFFKSKQIEIVDAVAAL